MCEFLAAASQVGDAVGGIATLVALIYAIRSVNAWKIQALHHKRGEVAARAAAAVVTMRSAVVRWLAGVSYFAGLEAQPLDQQAGARREFAHRAEIEEALKRVLDARGETATQLTSNEARSLRDVELAFVQALGQLQPLLHNRTEQGDALRILMQQVRTVCERWDTRLRAIEDEALATLRPIANLGSYGRWWFPQSAGTMTWATVTKTVVGVLAALALLGALAAIVLKR
jgi:hypothetical protein